MRVPSQVCCGKVALSRARLHMGACTDRLLNPCHHPPVSAPTPRRCEGSKDKKTKQTTVLDLCHLRRYGNHFFLCKGLHEDGQKESQKLKNVKAFSHGRTLQWAIRSDDPDPVLGSFWQVRTHARDDVEPRPPWRTPSCNSLGNHLQQQKEHFEQTVAQTLFEKCSRAKCGSCCARVSATLQVCTPECS